MAEHTNPSPVPLSVTEDAGKKMVSDVLRFAVEQIKAIDEATTGDAINYFMSISACMVGYLFNELPIPKAHQDILIAEHFKTLQMYIPGLSLIDIFKMNEPVI
jgi:hypothetical protein